MNRNKTTTQNLGRWSLIAVIAGNTAAMVGSLENVYLFFRKLLGVDWLSLGLFVFGGTVAVGFVLGAIWGYKRFLQGLTRRKRTILAAALGLFAAGAIWANVAILAGQQPTELILEARSDLWRERLVKCQAPDGGLRISYRDPAALPQAWTSAQALTAFLAASSEVSAQERAFVESAFRYIESVRREDDEEGWGYFPSHRRSVTEIMAWVILAYSHSLRPADLWSPAGRATIEQKARRDIAVLIRRQSPDGGWGPTNDVAPEFTRTYSTVMAVWALLEARESGLAAGYDRNIDAGVQWLLNRWRSDLWWLPNPHRENQVHRYHALTAQVLFVVSRAAERAPSILQDHVYQEALSGFLEEAAFATRAATEDDHLSDFDQYLLPTDFQIEGSTYLWYPWAMAALVAIAEIPTLPSEVRELANDQLSALLKRQKQRQWFQYVDSGPTYVVAEGLYCLRTILDQEHGEI